MKTFSKKFAISKEFMYNCHSIPQNENTIMIHKDKDSTDPVYLDDGFNPFYLFCNGIPLPLAVKQGNREACAYRDAWEQYNGNIAKYHTCYHPLMRNWVGGKEDGRTAVIEARHHWRRQDDPF